MIVVSQELLSLRALLLRETKSNEDADLYMDAAMAKVVIDKLDDLAMFAKALEEQTIPERLKSPTPPEGENIVSIDRFRKRPRPARGDGKGAA